MSVRLNIPNFVFVCIDFMIFWIRFLYAGQNSLLGPETNAVNCGFPRLCAEYKKGIYYTVEQGLKPRKMCKS